MHHRTECPHCEELQDRVAYLEEELGMRRDAAEIEALRRAFGLRPGPSYLLRALYAAKGKIVPALQLEDAIPSKDQTRERSFKVIDVYICAIRKKLGKAAIRTAWAAGYYLPPETMQRIAVALQPARDAAA